jgi:hypothetical protein
MRNLDQIQADAADALRAVAAAEAREDADAATHARKLAAKYLVEAREHFLDAEGNPDWTARTHAYRDFHGETFTLAGLSGTEAQKIRVSLRYHVGNAVRERLSPEEAAAAGLQAKAPKARMADIRRKQNQLTSVVTGGALYRDFEKMHRALDVSTATLRRFSETALAGLDSKEREDLAASLKHIAEEASRLATVATDGSVSSR